MPPLTMKEGFEKFVDTAVDSSTVKTIMRNLGFEVAENTLHNAGLRVIRDTLLKYTNTNEGTKRKIDLWDMKDERGDWHSLSDFVKDEKRVLKVKSDCKPLIGFVTHFEGSEPEFLKQSLKSLCRKAKEALKTISNAIVFRAFKVIQIVMSGAYLFKFWDFCTNIKNEESCTKLKEYGEQLSEMKETFENEILAKIEQKEIDKIDTQLLYKLEVQITVLGDQVGKQIRVLEEKLREHKRNKREYEQKSNECCGTAIGTGMLFFAFGALAYAAGGPLGWALGLCSVAAGCASVVNACESHDWSTKAERCEKSIKYLRTFRTKLADFEHKFRECMKRIQITDEWTFDSVKEYLNTKTKFNEMRFPKYFSDYMQRMKKAKWDVNKIATLTEDEYDEVFGFGPRKPTNALWKEIEVLQRNSGKLIINVKPENLSNGEGLGMVNFNQS